MKTVKSLAFQFCVFFFFLLLFNEAKANHSIAYTYVEEAQRQFKALIEYNEKNDEEGRSDLNNYVFVYTPGQEFNAASPPPYQWIFEAPEGAMPSAEYYHNLLVTYNEKITYQHYIVVINLRDVIQSLIKNGLDAVTETSPSWYNKAIEDIDGLNPTSDLIFYELQVNEIKQSFDDNFNIGSVFDPSANIYITYATILTELRSVGFENKLVEKKVDIQAFKSSAATQEFEEKLDSFYYFQQSRYPGEGLPLIGQRIKAFIDFFYNESVPNLPCNDIADQMLYDEAEIFISDRCPNVSNLEQKQFLFLSAQIVEYQKYLHNVDQTLFNLQDRINYYGAIVDGFLDDPEDPKDFLLYLRNYYDSHPDDHSVFWKRSYFQYFYNVDQSTPSDLKARMTAAHVLLDLYFSHWNFIFSNQYPGLNRSIFVEAAWDMFNDSFKETYEGVYTFPEKHEIFNHLKGLPSIRTVLWDKYMFGYGGGTPIIGVGADEVAINLSNFVVCGQFDLAAGGVHDHTTSGGPPQHVIIQGFSEKFAPNATHRDIMTTAEVDWNPALTEIDVTTSYCDRYNYYTYIDPDGQETPSLGSCAHTIDFTEITDEDFFDIAHLVILDNPACYQDYAFDGINPSAEDYNTSKPVGLFYLAYKDQKGTIDAVTTGLIITIQIVATIATYGAYTAATTAFGRLIYGIYTINNAVSILTLSSPEAFKEALGIFLGNPDAGEEYGEIVININILLGLAEGAQGIHAMAGAFLKPQHRKAAAFARYLDEAVSNTGQIPPGDLDALKLSRFGGEAKVAKAIRNQGAANEVNNIYYGLFGIQNTELIAQSQQLRRLIMRCKYNNIYPGIATKLDDLDNLGLLSKLVDDIDAFPNLVNYFSNAGSGAGMASRIDAWQSIYNTVLRTDTEWLDIVKALKAQQVEFIPLAGTTTSNIWRNGYHFGEIVGNQMRGLHAGPYGPLALAKNKTTTLWGRFWPDMPNPNTAHGTHYWRWLPTTKVGLNTGGYNLLAIENASWSWGKNHAWFKAAIVRGDEVLSCTSFNQANMWNQQGRLTATGGEFAVMLSLNFGVDAAGVMKPLSQLTPEPWWDDVLDFAQNNPWEVGGSVNMIDDVDNTAYTQFLNNTADPVVAPLAQQNGPPYFGNPN